MPTLRTIYQAIRENLQTVFFLVFMFFFVVGMGTAFYLRARLSMQTQLKEALKQVAVVAAQQFDAGEIATIRGQSSLKSVELKHVVSELQSLRSSVTTIRYAYILRRTSEPATLEFVADADSLSTEQELDLNSNGVADPDELPSLPGDTYDINQAPAMATAFTQVAVDDDITSDSWGPTISAYAPIHDARGEIIAILGIDMDAREFIALTHSIFSPLAYLLFCITALLLIVYMLVFLWQRKIESFRKIDRERSGLLLLTFHQLGTPLTTFSWSLETLLEAADKGEPLDGPVREHGKNMETAIGQLKNVLNGLKSASLVDEGNLSYKPETAPLLPLVNATVADLQETLRHREQQVLVHVDAGIALPLDRTLIGGVLRELLSNASCFSPEVGLIEVLAEERANDVLISVVDHGCGIAETDKPRLFTKYMRGERASTHRTDGLGMGLFVARGIIERAGGKIWIESTEGAGTRVNFTLPLSTSSSH